MDERRRASLPTNTLNAARSLRREATDAERKLWRYLRAGQLEGLRFRRQHPIPPYVVDFFCDAAKLVVELGGSQHKEEAERARARFLEARGLTVLRFWDNEALMQTEADVEAIWNLARPRPLTPTPLPMGEGL
ncbi:MAG: DUF559 domain-containing protein [Pseudomonadota bacterium]|nr:DUF559 domain-containing protein [Pseudomonadota bacterium]